jgi:hypothetical protein
LKKYKKNGAILIAFTLVLSISAVSSQEKPGKSKNIDFQAFQQNFSEMSEELSGELTFNSTLGLNWSDAYIGRLSDIPPRFGVGVSAGATSFNPASKLTFFNSLGMNFTNIAKGYDYLPIPSGVVEARIGGLGLPFDIGLKAMMLPLTFTANGYTMRMDHIFAGADLRYALVKGKGWLPKISFAAGFNYLKNNIETESAGTMTYSFRHGSPKRQYLFSVEQPKTSFAMENKTVDARIQISKKILIFTPYIGMGASYGWSTIGYGVHNTVKFGQGSGFRPLTSEDADTINKFIDKAGLNPLNIDKNGFSSEITRENYTLRAFGGLSLNLSALYLDVTGLYNILDKNFGLNIGVRLQ